MKRAIRLLALCLCLVFCLPLASCAARNQKVVGSCMGQDILYEELRLEALRYREDHPDATEEELREAVTSAIVNRYAVLLLAQEHLPGVDINSDAFRAIVDAEEERAIEQFGSKSKYKRGLKEEYANPHLMRRLLALTQLEMDVKTAIFKGTELESTSSLLLWLEDGNFVRVRRIRFVFTDATKEERKQEALAFYQRFVSGEKVSDLLPTFKNASAVQPAYYFKGLGEGELQDAALALASAQVDRGHVVEINGAWEVLIRLDNDRDSFINYQLSTVLEKYRSIRFEELLSRAIAQTTIDWNEYGLSLVLGKIK